MTRKPLALIAIVAFPATLAACGSSDDTSSTAASSDTSTTASSTESSTTAGGGSAQSVSLGETEYKIDPSDASVKAGSVTFDVSNDGQTTHNVEIEGNGVEDGTDDLAPGSSGSFTADLKPGTYTMYCSIDGHEDLGMKGTITVQ